MNLLADLHIIHQIERQAERKPLDILTWGYTDQDARLTVPSDADLYPVQLYGAPATGRPLQTNGHLGADLIRLSAGAAFSPHTHPGDHLLIPIAGKGTITYDGTIYPTRAGQIYMIEGSRPHAVGAITDSVIIAVGSPHKAIDDPERMNLVDYKAIAADLGDLTCLICNLNAVYPRHLHESGCKHCPCKTCTFYGSNTGDFFGKFNLDTVQEA